MRHIESAVVGYLDILGFKDLVRSSTDRRQAAELLDAAIARALEWFGGHQALRNSPDAEWRVRIFSDCLCVWKPATELGVLVTLEAVAAFTRDMMAAGYPLRGGLSLGPISSSEHVLFSPAQIEAYEIESNFANYPRVALSSSLLESINAIDDDEFRKDIKEHIVTAGDHVPFVNHFIFEEADEWLGGHAYYIAERDRLTDVLSDEKTPEAARRKHEWLAHYHNWAVTATARILKTGGVLSEDDVWSFSSLMIKMNAQAPQFASLLWTDPSFRRDLEDTQEDGVDWVHEWPGATTEDDEPDVDREPDD